MKNKYAYGRYDGDEYWDGDPKDELDVFWWDSEHIWKIYRLIVLDWKHHPQADFMQTQTILVNQPKKDILGIDWFNGFHIWYSVHS